MGKLHSPICSILSSFSLFDGLVLVLASSSSRCMILFARNLEASKRHYTAPSCPSHLWIFFVAHETSTYARENLPGAIIAKKERIVLNEGRKRVKLLVTNNGDRPIQVRLVLLSTVKTSIRLLNKIV